jgi:hypothetical protein
MRRRRENRRLIFRLVVPVGDLRPGYSGLCHFPDSRVAFDVAGAQDRFFASRHDARRIVSWDTPN